MDYFSVDPSRLLIASVLGIAFLLFLIMKVKLHSFLSILLAAVAIGFGVGMTPNMIIASINQGVGTTLQGIALLVGIGSMFGAMLEISGGAKEIATKMIASFGEKKAVWSLGIAGLIIGIPVFFDAGLLIVIPLAFAIAATTGKSTLLYGIPLLAGLSIAHAFMPPTPGPIIVADALGVDLGYVILVGIACAAAAMIVSGPIYANYISKKIHVDVPDNYKQVANTERSDRSKPSFWTVISIILIPLFLILANTASNAMYGAGVAWVAPLRPTLAFIGTPFMALLIATIVAMLVLGIKNGYTKEELNDVMGKSLLPVGMILLVTAGGGILRFVFENSGIGIIISDVVAQYNLPIMLVAFLVATAIRISVGSATVAMVMASGILATMPVVGTLSPLQLACVTMAVAGGATVCSHVNDSGFWLVKSLFNLSEKQTLQTWTVMATINGTVGFLVAWIIFMFV